MRGRIRLRSTPGQGSRFRVELPLETVAPVTPRSSQAITPPIVGAVVRTANKVLTRGLQEQIKQLEWPLLNRASMANLAGLTRGTILLVVDAETTTRRTRQHVDTLKAHAPKCVVRVVRLVQATENEAGRSREAHPEEILLRIPARLDAWCAAAQGTHNIREPEHLNRDDGADQIPEADATGPDVLLVEDSPANQAVAVSLLKREGYSVAVANNGVEAVEIAQQQRFAVILMDLAMPGMDGLEATRQLRANPGPNRYSAIVAMTANAFVEDRERCLAAGMDDFITKPLSIDKFREVVRMWAEDESERTGAFTDIAIHGESDADIVDERVLLKIAAETSWEVMPELIGIFLRETQERVARLLEQFNGGSLKAVGDEAHTLKSTAGSFGALRLQALGREIELATHSGNNAVLKTATSHLEPVTQQTCQKLEQFLEKHCRAQTSG